MTFSVDPATGTFALLHNPEPQRPGNRLNDATTDDIGPSLAGDQLTAGLTAGWVQRAQLFAAGHEGPSVLRMDDGTWRIYIDRYTNGGIWTATSRDLYTWSGLSAVACSGCRHGTVARA